MQNTHEMLACMQEWSVITLNQAKLCCLSERVDCLSLRLIIKKAECVLDFFFYEVVKWA